MQTGKYKIFRMGQQVGDPEKSHVSTQLRFEGYLLHNSFHVPERSVFYFI